MDLRAATFARFLRHSFSSEQRPSCSCLVRIVLDAKTAACAAIQSALATETSNRAGCRVCDLDDADARGRTLRCFAWLWRANFCGESRWVLRLFCRECFICGARRC